jgi:hypothetical protein
MLERTLEEGRGRTVRLVIAGRGGTWVQALKLSKGRNDLSTEYLRSNVVRL